jgi:selenocysteine lyase/cysteine desulfurase
VNSLAKSEKFAVSLRKKKKETLLKDLRDRRRACVDNENPIEKRWLSPMSVDENSTEVRVSFHIYRLQTVDFF